jgi:hypothetical protein
MNAFTQIILGFSIFILLVIAFKGFKALLKTRRLKNMYKSADPEKKKELDQLMENDGELRANMRSLTKKEVLIYLAVGLIPITIWILLKFR